MALVRFRDRFDPARELDRLQNEINQLFDLDWDNAGNTGLFERTVSPAIDVIEDNEGYTVYCNLPGVKDKDVDVTIADNVLTIKGEKQAYSPGEQAKVYRREDWSGSFQRTLALPRGVDAEKISAELKDGVLMVTLPKQEEVKPKQVKVNVS
jgi:HSP20 family protein